MTVGHSTLFLTHVHYLRSPSSSYLSFSNIWRRALMTSSWVIRFADSHDLANHHTGSWLLLRKKAAAADRKTSVGFSFIHFRQCVFRFGATIVLLIIIICVRHNCQGKDTAAALPSANCQRRSVEKVPKNLLKGVNVTTYAIVIYLPSRHQVQG